MSLRGRNRLRGIGILIIGTFLTIPVISSARRYLKNLSHEKKNELIEKQILGSVFHYNPHVKKIQEILEGAGFNPGPIDGKMGGQTRKAIREFQERKGLIASGRIDSETWVELMKQNEPTSLDLKTEEDPNSSLDRMRQIQMALKKAGFYTGEIDGKMGHQTRIAIESFQKTKGLKPDGIVGPKTWEELIKYLKNEKT